MFLCQHSLNCSSLMMKWPKCDSFSGGDYRKQWDINKGKPIKGCIEMSFPSLGIVFYQFSTTVLSKILQNHKQSRKKKVLCSLYTKLRVINSI